MLAIDQHDQRSSERLDLLRRRVRLREMEARGGGHTVGIVAGAAGGLLHHLIEALAERSFLRPDRI